MQIRGKFDLQIRLIGQFYELELYFSILIIFLWILI